MLLFNYLRPRWLIGCQALLCLVTAQTASATGRIAPAQLAALAENAGVLLANPTTNYVRICSCLIKPGVISSDQLLSHFQTDLKQADSTLSKAILLYLISETYYWGTLNDFQKTNDKLIFKDSAQSVIPPLLEAWHSVCKVEAGKDATKIRGMIVSRLRQLATTRLYGATLPPQLKRQMVAEFVNKIESQEDGPDSWTCEIRGMAYRNLGIEDRLKANLPKKMPTDASGIVEAMRLASSIGSNQDALQFAAVLEQAHGAELAKRNDWRHELFNVYRNAGDTRAFPLIRTMARGEPGAYMTLYDLSSKAEPSMGAPERRKYIEAYLEAVEKNNGTTPQVYLQAAQRMINIADYNGARNVIEAGLKKFNDASSPVVHLWYAKGLCCEKLGEPDQAIAAYRQCAELVSGIKNCDKLKIMCEKKLLKGGS